MKGNGWLIQGNTGVDAREDGFQTHADPRRLGRLATSSPRNTADVDGPGYGIALVARGANVVAAATTPSTGAAKGLSNIPCT